MNGLNRRRAGIAAAGVLLAGVLAAAPLVASAQPGYPSSPVKGERGQITPPDGEYTALVFTAEGNSPSRFVLHMNDKSVGVVVPGGDTRIVPFEAGLRVRSGDLKITPGHGGQVWGITSVGPVSFEDA